jgi:maleylacetate reductase
MTNRGSPLAASNEGGVPARLTPSSVCHVLEERLVFAPIDRLGEEVALLGRRPLIVSSPRWLDLAVTHVGTSDLAIVQEIAQHVPAALAMGAVDAAHAGRDVVVAVGGGSAVGLAKIVARDLGIPILAVPTTFSGSERTPIWGITRDGVKQTGRDKRVLPATVLYDPALVASLPLPLACQSAVNALAHAVEGMWVTDNPFTRAVCAQAIRTILKSLASLLDALERGLSAAADTWAEGLVGASLAGSVLALAGTGIHHSVAHVLGGQFGLPHAELHTMLLPYTSRLMAAHEVPGLAEIALAVAGSAASAGPQDVPAFLYDLARRVIGEPALSRFGIEEDRLLASTAALEGQPLPDGTRLQVNECHDLLRCAYAGKPP